MGEQLNFLEKLKDYGIKVLLPVETIIYKYSTFETALKIIESNCFRFQTADKFNDPFDLTNSLIDNTATSEIFNTWLNSRKIDEKTQKNIITNVNSSETYLQDKLDETLDKYKSIIGITCFSKSFNNILMWSHYSDKHSGITLGFNIYPVREKGQFILFQVNYVNEIIPRSFFLEKPFSLIYWLYTKSKVWEYEEEVRGVHMGMNGDIPFDKSCLKEVHFGLKTTEIQRKEILDLLKSLDYNINRATYMTLNPKTFDLKENEMTISKQL